MDRKYFIYENDLKFRSSRNLNLSNIDWKQNDIKHLYDIDHDTLQYRTEACIKSGYNDLDLEQMNISNIPTYLFNNNNFSNIKNLFISNNNLIDQINLSFFKNLEMVDLDNNKLTNIILPNNIIEISCNNNLLDSIPDLKKAKRCRMSNNKIKIFSISSIDIEIIELDNNDITQIDISQYNKLKKIVIFKNPLTYIKMSNNNVNLKYVDLSETKIINLDNINHINHLVLNHCIYIRELPKSDYLQTLEIINTPIEKLQFYKEFELIIFQMNLVKNVSSKYKLANANIQLRKNIYVVISKENVEFQF